MAAAGEPPVQVVDKDGLFNAAGVEDFVQASGVAAAGGAYQMVAIMGPQSSGKSTLLNNLFGTGFREMNAEEGRSQTTQGIWVSRSHKLEACTLVLDLEGSDGRERGEDDTAFERQAALFAMAVADVLLVNIWCHDIGREAGAGKPLMKTILQVHLKLLQDEGKRTHLVFVIRDKSKKTPLSSLQAVLKEDLQKMWDSVPKPPHMVDRALDDFFQVMYVALSSYEEREEEFKAEVVMLRQRFDPDHEDSFVKPESKLPGSALAMSAERLWEVVHSHKDLNLPAHKVMVANIRCKEIMTDRLAALQKDQAWEALASQAEQALQPDFGSVLAGLMSSCVAGYDEEAQYFDVNVRKERRSDLLEALHGIGAPLLAAQQRLLGRSVTKTLQESLAAADSGNFSESAAAALADAEAAIAASAAELHVDVDGIAVFAAEEAQSAEQLKEDAAALVEEERARQVGAAGAAVGAKAAAAMGQVAAGLLEDMPDDLWPALRDALRAERQSALAQLGAKLKGYAPRDGEIPGIVEALAQKLRQDVEHKAREAASRAVNLLKEKFNTNFNFDANGIPRVWGARDNIPKITGDARAASALCLAQLAVLRLDAGVEDAAAPVEAALLEHLVEGDAAKPAGSTSGASNSLALSAWAGVPEAAVMLAPPECRRIWRQFRAETDFVVSNASNTQQAHQMASNRMPPLWAILAIAFFGFDEFLGILYNPIYMMLGVMAFLFARQLYIELDVDTEMQKGALPGLLNLSAKAGPVLRQVTLHTAEAVGKLLAGEQGLAARAVASLSPHKQAGAGGNVEMSAMPGRRAGDGAGLRHRGGGETKAAAPTTSHADDTDVKKVD